MEARPAPAVSSSHADLRFSELRFGSAWMLRGDPRQSSFLETARDCLGLPLPLQSNTSVRAANNCCLWLGPRAWLWLADEPSSTVDTTRRRVGGAGGALFELSSSYVGWLTRGPAIAKVLNRLCPMDLHPSAFPAGACAQTLLGHIGGCLFRTSADAFVVLVARSFARDACHELCGSAAAQGYAIDPPVRLADALA